MDGKRLCAEAHGMSKPINFIWSIVLLLLLHGVDLFLQLRVLLQKSLLLNDKLLIILLSEFELYILHVVLDHHLLHLELEFLSLETLLIIDTSLFQLLLLTLKLPDLLIC